MLPQAGALRNSSTILPQLQQSSSPPALAGTCEGVTAHSQQRNNLNMFAPVNQQFIALNSHVRRQHDG